MQYFAQSPHEPLLAAALAAAEDQGITPELAAVHLSDGVARYWQRAHRAGYPATADDAAPTREEAERLRQLEMVRRAVPTYAKSTPDS
jgi:hypothetical protein